MKKQVRAKPRREREYPKVYSLNFPQAIIAKEGEKCFVPLDEFCKLERKYYRLFKRYKQINRGLA